MREIKVENGCSEVKQGGEGERNRQHGNVFDTYFILYGHRSISILVILDM